MKATIKFLNDWTQTLDGDLVQGGELAVDYELSRLPARRDTFRGAAMWDIFVLVRFQPDGQILAASVTAPVSSSPGGMTVDRSPAEANSAVPGDAAHVELWFLNIGYAHFGEPPKAWDSHFGDNYVFAVQTNSPAQPVTPRQGAQANRGMVNAFALTNRRENAILIWRLRSQSVPVAAALRYVSTTTRMAQHDAEPVSDNQYIRADSRRENVPRQKD